MHDDNSESESGGGQAPIQAIVNAVDAIDYISKSNQGVGVRELARELRMTRGTANRVLYSLHSCGLLRRDEEHGRYLLGAKILELASGHQRSLSIGQVARRHMSALSQEIGETVFLGILDHDHVTIVDRIDSKQPLRMASELGLREPFYCTALGKIMMADLPEADCLQMLKGRTFERYTAKTLMNAEEIVASIRKAGQRGWALDDEEFFEGVRCIAAAVRDHEGVVIAAVSLSGPKFRLDTEKIPELAKRVAAAAAAISRDLGYVPKVLHETQARR